MGYVAPTWQNGGPPALNAKNMQDISDNLAYVSNHMVNPGLTDNWYFGNPVNQRGQTSYAGAGYSIDRWKLFGDNVSATINGGVQCTASSFFYQVIEQQIMDALDGRAITLSALLKDNRLLYGTWTVDNSVTNNTTIAENEIISLVRAPWAGNAWGVYFKVADTVVAVKLELGSQQTLAHKEYGDWVLNEIPKFGDQLAECQRYYFKAASAQYSAYMMRKVGNDYLMDSCLFPVTMRTTPSIQLLSYRNPATGAVITAEGTASQVTPDGFCIVQDVGKFNSGDVFQVSFSATADL